MTGHQHDVDRSRDRRPTGSLRMRWIETCACGAERVVTYDESGPAYLIIYTPWYAPWRTT